MTDWVDRDSTHLGTDRIFTAPTAQALYDNALAVREANAYLIEEQTASASGALNFTTGINSDFEVYEFRFLDIVPVTDGVDFLMRFSTDGGSSYLAAGTDYRWGMLGIADDGTGANSTSAGTASSIGLSTQSANYRLDNGASAGYRGNLFLFNPSSSTKRKQVKFDCSYHADNALVGVRVLGQGQYAAATTAVNAVRFIMSSGNISSGTIRMYGRNSW